MTGWDLRAWVSSHESGWNHIALAALRDAIRAEASADASDEYPRRLVEAQGRAEHAEALLKVANETINYHAGRTIRAERERDSAVLELESTKEFLRLSRNRRDALKMQLSTVERERDDARAGLRNQATQILAMREQVAKLTFERDSASDGNAPLAEEIARRAMEAQELRKELERAEAALGEAKREAGDITDDVLRLAWDAAYTSVEGEFKGRKVEWSGHDKTDIKWHREFVLAALAFSRRYPATPSEEGVPPAALEASTRATPQPEPLVIPVVDTFGVPRITITPALARRIIAMGQKETYL